MRKILKTRCLKTDLHICLPYCKAGNTEIKIIFTNLFSKTHSQIKKAQVNFEKESKAVDAASEYQCKYY